MLVSPWFGVMAVARMPSPAALFDLLQGLPLFIREAGSHLTMCLLDDLAHTPAGIAPHVAQLGSSFINDRGNLGHLLRRQIEILAQALFHSRCQQSRSMCFNKEMPRVHAAQNCPGNSTCDKDQDESGQQFPLQGAVHCENSSCIAVSAMANSFVSSLYTSRLSLASYTAASDEMRIIAHEARKTLLRSPATPFGLGLMARQRATTRVSNPNGMAGGASSPACAADRNNLSS